MKKFVLIILAIFTIFASYESKAYCPTGYTTTTLNLVLADGCTYAVEICFKCSPLGGAAFEAALLSVEYVSGSVCSTSASSIWSMAADAVQNNFVILCTIPPCPATKQLNVYKPLCVKKISYFSAFYNRWQIKHEGCENDEEIVYCKITASTCMDYTQTPPAQVIFNKTYSIYPDEAIVDCDAVDPEPADPENGGSTACFLITCPVN